MFDTIAAYAPAIYNITRGLEKSPKVNRRFVTPQTYRYENMSQPSLNAINDAFEAAVGNARNLSGGLASNFRSNTEKAWADKFNRISQVNVQESGRADQIANNNIGILNKGQEINQQVNANADQQDLQNEAATNSFLAMGMKNLADISSLKAKEANMKDSESTVLKLYKQLTARPGMGEDIEENININPVPKIPNTPIKSFSSVDNDIIESTTKVSNNSVSKIPNVSIKPLNSVDNTIMGDNKLVSKIPNVSINTFNPFSEIANVVNYKKKYKL